MKMLKTDDPSKVINSIECACLLYYGLGENKFKEVIKLCMSIAKNDMSCDVIAMHNIMDNNFEDLKYLHFAQGDGILNWYLTNWSLGNN
jgi:hypothetical protein